MTENELRELDLQVVADLFAEIRDMTNADEILGRMEDLDLFMTETNLTWVDVAQAPNQEATMNYGSSTSVPLFGIGDEVSFAPAYATNTYPASRVYRVTKVNPTTIQLEDANGARVKCYPNMLVKAKSPMPEPTIEAGEGTHLNLGTVVTVAVPARTKWNHSPSRKFVVWGYRTDGRVKLAVLGGHDGDRYQVVPRSWCTTVETPNP